MLNLCGRGGVILIGAFFSFSEKAFHEGLGILCLFTMTLPAQPFIEELVF